MSTEHDHRLFLVPAPLSQTAPAVDLLPADLSQLRSLRFWLVETPKVARAWLKLYAHPGPLSELTLVALSDFTNDPRSHQDPAQAKTKLSDWLETVAGPVGLMSDAGCPGVADPGADAVACAHALGWKVVPMVGPSSILLALMASGLNGQRFTFHGYAPVEDAERRTWIQETQRASATADQTQIAIETPYRNNPLLKALCDHLSPDTRLCIASELRGPDEFVLTQSVAAWRKSTPTLPKQATLFLWQSPPSLNNKKGGRVSAGESIPIRAGSGPGSHRNSHRRA